MKLLFFLVFAFVTADVVLCRALDGERCSSLWDDGCINNQIPGAGKDEEFLNGGFNPGKRCVSMWEEGCANNQLPGAGKDEEFLNGGFNPGKRCLWDEGCSNGEIPGAGKDEEFINGGFGPGKRNGAPTENRLRQILLRYLKMRQ